MSKVAIVTDSTAYIPEELIQQYAITVAPLTVIWGNETFKDGVDMRPSEFYTRLQSASIMPTTSQVTPGAFESIFRDLLARDYDVLAILISRALSGTMDSACQARELFPGAPIEIMDSTTTAMAMGFQVLATARAAASGAGMKECKEIAEQARQNTGVIFAVDTLEFLHRGGRIGGGSRFMGTALNIKPILEVTGGHIEAVERVRTRKKSLHRLLELVEERVKGQHPIHLASIHANSPEDAREMLSYANGQFNAVEQIVAEVSPVIGTHSGPGTIGLAYMTRM